MRQPFAAYYGVLIWTSYTGGSLTVTLYSTPFATAEQTAIREGRSGNCTVVGNYSQRGHMGTVEATYSCTFGVNGTMTLYELERTSAGMTGRFVAENNRCSVAGTLGGVER